MPGYVVGEDGKQYPVQVVEAVGVCASASHVGSKVGATGAKRIQEAMTYAVEWCFQQGITDPEKVREYMMLAREEVKQVIAAEQVTPKGNTEG